MDHVTSAGSQGPAFKVVKNPKGRHSSLKMSHPDPERKKVRGQKPRSI